MAVCSTTTFCKYLTRLLNVGQLLREKAIGTTRGHAKGDTLATSGPYRRPLFKSGLKFWAELSVGRACRYRQWWPRRRGQGSAAPVDGRTPVEAVAGMSM